MFNLSIKIVAEFIKRIANCTIRCEKCMTFVNPCEGQEINMFADFGIWKYQIGHSIFMCDDCAEKIKKNKDIDINSLNPENFK